MLRSVDRVAHLIGCRPEPVARFATVDKALLQRRPDAQPPSLGLDRGDVVMDEQVVQPHGRHRVAQRLQRQPVGARRKLQLRRRDELGLLLQGRRLLAAAKADPMLRHRRWSTCVFRTPVPRHRIDEQAPRRYDPSQRSSTREGRAAHQGEPR